MRVGVGRRTWWRGWSGGTARTRRQTRSSPPAHRACQEPVVHVWVSGGEGSESVSLLSLTMGREFSPNSRNQETPNFKSRRHGVRLPVRTAGFAPASRRTPSGPRPASSGLWPRPCDCARTGCAAAPESSQGHGRGAPMAGGRRTGCAAAPESSPAPPAVRLRCRCFRWLE